MDRSELLKKIGIDSFKELTNLKPIVSENKRSGPKHMPDAWIEFGRNKTGRFNESAKTLLQLDSSKIDAMTFIVDEVKNVVFISFDFQEMYLQAKEEGIWKYFKSVDKPKVTITEVWSEERQRNEAERSETMVNEFWVRLLPNKGRIGFRRDLLKNDWAFGKRYKIWVTDPIDYWPTWSNQKDDREKRKMYYLELISMDEPKTKQPKSKNTEENDGMERI